ncbi:MAG: hypothetical protein KGP29_05460 [Proteobacteria bacterium]|nr:hypothetical protein [Pseudomonadota bacterium]
MAQIQIWTRDVNNTGVFGEYAPQHTFLVKVNDDGTREILRGGPVDDNMLLGDVEVMNQEYNDIKQSDKTTDTLDWYDPSLPNTQNFQGETIKSSSQSEIDTLWNNALTKAQEINSQTFDYEITSQNCNTVTYQLATEMGLETEVSQFISDKKLSTPGYGDEFTPELIERAKYAWNSFEEATEYMVKEYVKSLITTATTISTATQLIFNTLLSAEESFLPARRVDPLTLDLDNDGIELVNVTSSTAFFDLDVIANEDGTYTSDGVKEQVGWVSSDDGLLTLDKNGNGEVDNILELFGKTNKTGTQELREYDLNSDGVINSNDSVFSQLKVWQDFNQNGLSESSELKSLTDLGITSINVSEESLTPRNQISEGNLIISEGTYTQTTTNPDGSTSQLTRSYANLDLAVNQTNSSSYTYTDPEGNIIGDYDLNLDVLSLPMSRGYGNVKALPIAASQNTNLLNLLKELTSLTPQNFKNINPLVEEIITSWAQTDSIDSSLMRGSFSAQKLATMEAFRGEEYTTREGTHDVEFWQLVQVQTAWNVIE